MTTPAVKGIASAATLSSPWDTLQRKLAHTIGRDPAITVSDVNTSTTPYAISVVLDDSQKGAALATILKQHFQYGPGINIHVQNSKGTSYINPIYRKLPVNL